MRTVKNRYLRGLAVLLALAFVAAACSPAATTETTEAAAPTPAPAPAPTPAPAPEPTPAPAPQTFEVAYLSASSANTWLGASRGAMQTVAAAAGINITEFDAEFNVDLQTTQLQDIIASGEFDGIIVAALFGEGLIPDLEEALALGMKIVVLNQVVGPALDTAEPQVDGFSASVLAPPLRSGERMGELVVQACADKDPCNVVYFYGIRGIPLDIALRDGFDAVTSANPAITVVAEGEGLYLGPDQGIAQMQDILVATPDFDVVVGADQPIQGVEIVLSDAGRLEGVALIGLGGSTHALAAISSGTWFAGVMGAPATEGRLAMEAMVAALIEGTSLGGIDPLTELPDGGLVVKDNVMLFLPEWNG